MSLTSSAGLIALMMCPLRDRGIPSLTRFKPTRFAAEATQLVRRALTDGIGKYGAIRSVAFSALREACWDEETVGDMKCGDPVLTANLYLLADGSRPFLLLLMSVFMVASLRVFFGATMINRN